MKKLIIKIIKWFTNVEKKIGSRHRDTEDPPKLKLHKKISHPTLRKTTITAPNGNSTNYYLYGYSPPLLSGFKWFKIDDEKPRYYDRIHIWDGDTMNMDWHRVWSEELEQDVYVNDRDNKVITKITHWTAPENVRYPKYEPMTSDDIREFTRRDLKELKEKMSDLLIGNEDGVDPVARLTYNSGVEECITLINKRLRNTPT